jgi:tRNA(fMet)-specific endonuclease VapC
MNYLLDTCVISELVARQPNPKVIDWIDGVEETRLYLSVITIGEIRKGVEKLPDSARKALLTTWLNDQLLMRFSGRIITLDVEVILRWGQLTGSLEAVGKTMPAIDSLIAATALHHAFTLVIRNEDDFKETGVFLLNPWK